MSGTGENGHLVIPQGKVPASAYQAIYHKLTSKVEKLTETFDERYDICVNDIVHLDTMLNQVVYPLKPEGRNSYCNVSFRKDEGINFSSVDKLRLFNFTTQKCTESIEYNFDFYTILPVEIKEAEDIVQRFKVKLKIDQDFVEEDSDIPPHIRHYVTGRNIMLLVEYSDYAVGRSLQSCVQDWVTSLPCRKVNGFVKLLDKKSDALTAFTPYVFSASLLFGLSSVQVDSQVESTSFILFSLSISILTLIFGKILIVEFFKNLAYIKPLTFINFTNGDATRKREISNTRSLKIGVSSFFAITIACNILTNLFANSIWEKIGRM